MSPDARIWVAILGVGATGILTRCSFLLFGERIALPPAIERALRLAPAAPSILVIDSGAVESIENPRLAAAIVAALVMWGSRQMLWSMAAGVAVFTAIRLLLAA